MECITVIMHFTSALSFSLELFSSDFRDKISSTASKITTKRWWFFPLTADYVIRNFGKPLSRLHTHSSYPNDFTDPVCHLLGKSRNYQVVMSYHFFWTSVLPYTIYFDQFDAENVSCERIFVLWKWNVFSPFGRGHFSQHRPQARAARKCFEMSLINHSFFV